MEVPAIICKAKKLRTLLTESDKDSKIEAVLPDIFCHLTCLRTLYLSFQSIKVVPQEVERLIHLRFLDLSHNDDLKKLPETICNLYNLQILDVSYCQRLKKLPQGMGKLINLRHLNLDGINFRKPFLKGLEKLSSLRTLCKFIVGGNDDTEGSKLGELKILNHLGGDFEIKGLGNLIEVYEAKNAQLKKKIHLRYLILSFDGEGEDNRRMENDVQLLDALEPHLDLEQLEIQWYCGTTIFRNWLMSIKLKKLRLWNCNKLECLPSLGRLPFLESLHIWEVESVKKVGVEFLGIESKDKKKDEGLASSSSPLIFFPNLKSLVFVNLKEWEEWDGIGGLMKEVEKDDGFAVMPLLHSLRIQMCPKLKALPHFLQKTPLQELFISDCQILNQRYEKGTGEDWPKISHIPRISIDFGYVLNIGH